MKNPEELEEQVAAFRQRSPIQALVDSMSAAWLKDRSRSQMTLGKLLLRLVELDDVVITPSVDAPHSYRGYYTDLALEPTEDEPPTAKQFAALLRGCIDKTFQGYKGGDYVMTLDTPMWVANYSEGGKRIMGVSDAGELQLSEDPALG